MTHEFQTRKGRDRGNDGRSGRPNKQRHAEDGEQVFEGLISRDIIGIGVIIN